MEQCLERALGELVSLAAKLNIIPGSTPLPVSDDDVRRWRAGAAGSDAWLVEDRGRSVATLLKLMRNHRETLQELAWEAQFETDLEELDRTLTDAAIGSCRVPDWLWLRLKMLRFAQDEAGPGGISALFRGFELDVDSLVLARDAAIVARATTPDGDPQAAADLANGDEAFARAAGGLPETLNARQRQRFASDSEIRDALDRLGVDPDACLAVDAAAAFAARCRESGDPRTAGMVDLIAHLLVAGGSASEVFGPTDWEALKRNLAAGKTDQLALAADGSKLTGVMLSALYDPHSPPPVPAHWTEQVAREYWAPFRRSVLRDGATWAVDALCLLAGVHAAVDPDGKAHTLAEAHAAALDLDGPADPDGTATRLECLKEAVLRLRPRAFCEVVPDQQAERITADLLASPPRTDSWVRSVLGLEGKSFYERVLEQAVAVGGPDESASAKVRFLHELVALSLQCQGEDSGRLLSSIAACPAIGLDKAALVECVVFRDWEPLRAVPTGGVLKLLIDGDPWLAGSMDVQTWVEPLRQQQYRELCQAVGPQIAEDPHSGLNIAWKLLTGGSDEGELLKNYEIQRDELERLVQDFYAGDAEALARRVLVHVPESTPVERVRSRPFAAVHVYAALLAALVICYAVLHVYVISVPPVRRSALPTPETSFQSLSATLKGLGVLASDLYEQDRPVYVACRPVTYEEYESLMTVPAGVGGQQVGVGKRKPVHFVNYEEAQEYCRRLTDYLQATAPGLFSDELDGYVCRLPKLAEARQVDLQLPPGSGMDGEWIGTDVPRGPQGILAAKPVRKIGPGASDTEMRRRAEERTTFRVVLSPTRP